MVWHGSPWVVLGGWLWVPHISSVASQVAGLKSICDCICLADLASSCVDQVGALGHLSNHLLVEEVLCTLHTPGWQVSGSSACWPSDWTVLFAQLLLWQLPRRCERVSGCPSLTGMLHHSNHLSLLCQAIEGQHS